jgi:hypothetical protein
MQAKCCSNRSLLSSLSCFTLLSVFPTVMILVGVKYISKRGLFSKHMKELAPSDRNTIGLLTCQQLMTIKYQSNQFLRRNAVNVREKGIFWGRSKPTLTYKHKSDSYCPSWILKWNKITISNSSNSDSCKPQRVTQVVYALWDMPSAHFKYLNHYGTNDS